MIADWSPSSDPYLDLNQDSVCLGKSERLFNSANWAMVWLKIYLKIQDIQSQSWPDLRASAQQWQVKQFSLWESYRTHRLLADRVLDDGNISGYCFLLPSELICCSWILCDEWIHILWEEGQIMKVIDLNKQPKISRLYLLVLFTKPHEMPWTRKHSSHCFVSQHFFTWG